VRGECHQYCDKSPSGRGCELPRGPPPSLLADEAGGTCFSPMGKARSRCDGTGRSLRATWILSGIDAMGVKLFLYQRQKGVQVYDTQMMLCDKKQWKVF
jgi:hypothetical protein